MEINEKLLFRSLEADLYQLRDDLATFYDDSLQNATDDATSDIHNISKDYQLLIPIVTAIVGRNNIITLSKLDFEDALNSSNLQDKKDCLNNAINNVPTNNANLENNLNILKS